MKHSHHRFASTSQWKFFIFIPWFAFWQQQGDQIKDYNQLRIAFSSTKNCQSLKNNLEVIVAQSFVMQQQGFRGRHHPLTPNEGMLFVFQYPEFLSFWMKETYIPLQIAYFDTQGKLIQLYEMLVEKDPQKPTQVFLSQEKAQLALEMKPKTLSENLLLFLCVQATPSYINVNKNPQAIKNRKIKANKSQALKKL